MKRSSGVLMHVTSLSGRYSAGTFGKEARDFIDFLCDCGFSYWQTLPFCMADECNSPYKSYSAFAGNPYFIDPEQLFEDGLITREELDSAADDSEPYFCNYEKLNRERLPLLRVAASRADKELKSRVEEFIASKPQLEKFCKFMALKEANGYAEWSEWTVKKFSKDELFAWKFIQYEFFKQWYALKTYANEKGISIIGDIPIYVSYDSCDVWADKKQFDLDRHGRPNNVAGCPPDYFSEDGQFWGNPLYNWSYMKEDGYSWWVGRMSYMLEMFDGVRIDHFRGFESYWSIPANAETAKEGRWIKGPGKDFISVVKKLAKKKLIIAEDLGDITEEVNKLVEFSGFPGMSVFQFAFLGDGNSPHLPHNYPNNKVAYTGTHDNNTLLGYLWELDGETRGRMLSYCGFEREDWTSAEAYDAMLMTMLGSSAGLVILPIQDVLRYGADTRMNTPGVAGGNWRYRLTSSALKSVDIGRMRYLNELYSRK